RLFYNRPPLRFGAPPVLSSRLLNLVGMCECVHDSPSWTHNSHLYSRSTHGGNRTLTYRLRARNSIAPKECSAIRVTARAAVQPHVQRRGGGTASERSSLWNSDHIEVPYEPQFLDELERLTAQSQSVGI